MPSSPSRQAELRALVARPFAHRGLHGPGRAENSRAAFEAAISAGHGIELDVQASADGEAMIFHDHALERLSEGFGEVRSLAAAELALVRLKGSDETIPTLAEILALVAGRAPLLIEVKSPGRRVAALCRAILRALAGYRGPTALMSFNPEIERWFARHAPERLRGLVVTEAGRKWRGAITRYLALWRSRPDFLAYDIRDLPSRFAAAQRAKGMKVLAWTCRTPEDRARAAEHADQIIYEVPPRAGGEAIVARVARSVAAFDPADWDLCAGGGDPFTSHAFLSALEDSGSAVAETGWQPVPVAIDGTDGRPAALLPAYLKRHSLGEYVFDHGWAHAFERVGGEYYPKLQIAVPFTPVSGRRLLARDPALAPALIAAAEKIVETNELSSAHATFITPGEAALFGDAGWLIRTDSQFHWLNQGYGGFEDFLATLSSRKRKAIRRERARAADGLDIVHLTGADIGDAHWDAFWAFYQNTGARKWGRPYLTREFFPLLGERMGDKLLLILALRGGVPIAGALHVIGADALYGRYWGAGEEVPYLHFELCYYQAIEAAIARSLARAEAGAQGEHKLARGYRPVPTLSAHYVADPDFREAVKDYLEAERRAVDREMALLEEMAPFRRS